MKLSSRVLLTLARLIPRGYWRVVRFAAAHDPSLWDLPVQLRLLPGEFIRADLREPVFTSFLREGCFPHQVGEDLLCLNMLRPGDTVFDVGANVGYPTILFSHAVGSVGRVLAIEPSPRAFGLLRRTLRDLPNVECLNVAVSDREGRALFYETPGLDTSSLELQAEIEPYSVTTTTVDQLVERFGVPSFVKIDVEGHEPSVIKGMTKLLRSEAPPIVLFEGGYGTLARTLSEVARLGGARYEVFGITPHGTLSRLDDPAHTNNYLALPEWGRLRVEGVTHGRI